MADFEEEIIKINAFAFAEERLRIWKVDAGGIFLEESARGSSIKIRRLQFIFRIADGGEDVAAGGKWSALRAQSCRGLA